MTFKRFAGATFGAACVVSSAGPGIAAPVAPPIQAKFERALAAHDYQGATIALNELIADRLPAAEPKSPDPLLDRLYAELGSSLGAKAGLTVMLERAVATSPAADKQHFCVLLASTQEMAGEFAKAESDYRAVGEDRSAKPEDRFSATIGLARVVMLRDPASALKAADEAFELASAENRWEADMMRARAAAILGQGDIFKAAIQRAWIEALDAGANTGAVARVARDLALASARDGNRQRLTGLLAVDRLNRPANVGQNMLAANLPLCGKGGIGPDDVAVLEILRSPPPGRPSVSLAWASRPGIGASFVNAALRSDELQAEDGVVASVALRCRTAPSSSYTVRATWDEELLAWSSGQGAYPVTMTDDIVADPTFFPSILAERERRYGTKSVMLLPALTPILNQTQQNMWANPDARTRAAAIVARIRDIMEAAGAPAHLILAGKLMSIWSETFAQNEPASVAQEKYRTLVFEAARDPNTPLDVLYALVSGLADAPQAGRDLKLALLEAALKAFDARLPKDDPRVIALALDLMAVRREQGDVAAADALAKTYSFASDLCLRSDPAVHFVSSNIVSDDYPNDLIQVSLVGTNVVEFSIAVSGEAVSRRILVSDPPYAFDAVALEKSATIRYEAARFGGKASACRGQVQNVRWQLPY